jgi:hypothetical protein
VTGERHALIADAIFLAGAIAYLRIFHLYPCMQEFLRGRFSNASRRIAVD